MRERLRTLRQRYGRRRFAAAGDRLEAAVSRRHYQLREVRRQIAELEQRAQGIESELRGFGKGFAALVGEEIAGYERTFPEAWSPTPVRGFRLWTIDGDRMVGARQVWDTPVFHASCAGYPDADEIPHTDDRCGRLGCGVYATKELETLVALHIRDSDRNYAVGVVGMSGKVVEHDDGYRAARAEVASLAVIGDERFVCTADPDVIAAAFANPVEVLESEWSCSLEMPTTTVIEALLSERMSAQWT